MNKKIIAIIVMILIVITINLFSIRLVSPKHNAVIEANEVLFKWKGYNKNYTLVIDNNREFTSPKTISLNTTTITVKNLLPEEYFWKIISNKIESRTGRFSITSVVAINRSYINNSLEITNTGNTDLNITLEKDRITGLVIEFPIKKGIRLKEGKWKIKAEQK